MIKRIIAGIIINLFLTSFLFGAINYSGFLAKGVGARAAGMAGAFTALADNTSAIINNASALANTKSMQLSTLYSKFFGEVNHQWLGICFPGAIGSFAVGYISMSVNDIIQADINGTILGNFNYTDQALFLSYATELLDNFNIGVSVKAIQQSALSAYTGFGMDVSFLYRMGNMNWGLNLQDIAKTEIGTDLMATRATLGLAWFMDQFTFTGDLKIVETQLTSGALGVEGKLTDFFSLTGGLNEQSFNLGVHLDFSTLTIDYSYQSHVLGNISQVELGVKF